MKDTSKDRYEVYFRFIVTDHYQGEPVSRHETEDEAEKAIQDSEYSDVLGVRSVGRNFRY